MMKASFNMSSNVQRREITTNNISEIALEIFHDAKNYHLVAINSMQTLFPQAMVVITVNAAFACELFLKSILLLEQKQLSRGHLIYKLFNEIQDTSLKMRIINRLKCYDFDSYLKEIDDVFSIARYVYECRGISCDLSFVISFANALLDECQVIFNEVNN